MSYIPSYNCFKSILTTIRNSHNYGHTQILTSPNIRAQRGHDPSILNETLNIDCWVNCFGGKLTFSQTLLKIQFLYCSNDTL